MGEERPQRTTPGKGVKDTAGITDVGMVQGAHRSIAGFIAAAMLIGACSGNAESLPLPDVIESRSFTPDIEHGGRWDIFRVPDGGRVIGIVDAGTGPVAAIAAPKRNKPNRDRLRFYGSGGDEWEPITDWVGLDTDSRVTWAFVSVVDGAIVVTGNTRRKDEGMVSVVLDPASDPPMPAASRVEDGPERFRDTITGSASVLAISSVAQRMAIWDSSDGRDWVELGPPEGWPEDTVALLELAQWDGIWAIRARRGEGRNKTDFVMTSRDGIEWQVADFDVPGYDGITQVEAVGTDGSALLALGYQAGGVVTQASTDGVTWSAPQPAEPGIFGDFPLRFRKIGSYPDGAFLAGGTHHNTDYRHCYVPGRACRVRLNMVWLARDGIWRPIVAPSGSETKAVAFIDDTLYVGGDGSIATWIPDEPGTIPIAEMPVDEPPQFGARLHDGCSPLQPGVTYAWIGHEGSARFNDVYWEIDTVTDGAAEILAESGSVEGNTIYGTVELISPDRIEWSIPGYGPIAYLRAGDPLPGDTGYCL